MRGDLTQKITVDAKGEIPELKETLNTMVDQLSSFADEVMKWPRRSARRASSAARLRSRASGTWRGLVLTENVNQLASNLTTQVRAIAEVSTAVTQGDLTRSIKVEAKGEVADLSDNINQMIANLRETTRQNEEQDWLKTNLARISGLMQGQRDLETVSQLIMSELSPAVSAQHGAFFIADHEDEEGGSELRLLASYGYTRRRSVANRFRAGEACRPGGAREEADPHQRPAAGLHPHLVGPRRGGAGQHHRDSGAVRGAGARGDRAGLVPRLRRDHPAVPRPVDRDDRRRPLDDHRQRPYRAAAAAVPVPGAGAAKQSQALQTQQEELRATNEELQEKAEQLERQNRDIEIKNREIETAQPAGGEGRAARAQLEVQVGVPREHVARAAHAAQPAADPLEGAELERADRQPDEQAGRLGGDDPQRRLGPARAHQRHPRPV